MVRLQLPETQPGRCEKFRRTSPVHLLFMYERRTRRYLLLSSYPSPTYDRGMYFKMLNILDVIMNLSYLIKPIKHKVYVQVDKWFTLYLMKNVCILRSRQRKHQSFVKKKNVNFTKKLSEMKVSRLNTTHLRLCFSMFSDHYKQLHINVSMNYA